MKLAYVMRCHLMLCGVRVDGHGNLDVRAAVEELETDRNAGLMAVGQAVGEERVVKTR